MPAPAGVSELVGRLKYMWIFLDSQSTSATVTWADAAQGVGTAIGAVLTAAAIWATLKVARDASKASADALSKQHALLRDQASREFRLDLLLKIQEQMGIYWAHGGAPQASESGTALIGLLEALASRDELPLARLQFGSGTPDERDHWEGLARLNPANSIPPVYRDIIAEVAAAIRETAAGH